MKQWGILVVGVLVAGLFTIGFLDQDVFAPKPQPTKIKIGPVKLIGDGFDVKIKVKFSKEIADRLDYKVITTIELFKADGTPIRASLSSTDTVPTVDEGGQNSRVHKLLTKIPYEPPGELRGEKIKVVVTSELLDPTGTPAASGHNDGFVKLIFD
jgi:hypothetical protein